MKRKRLIKLHSINRTKLGSWVKLKTTSRKLKVRRKAGSRQIKKMRARRNKVRMEIVKKNRMKNDYN
jgi:mRNA-degrading endonuclease toxin of MazEF toxin-antitoxin module